MAVKLNTADLQFILRQIKIAEANAAGTPLTEIYVDAAGNVVDADAPGAVLAIPDPLVPNGLRTVDGTYNNLVAGRETWGAADQAMPRLLDGSFLNDADGDEMPFGPPGPETPIVTNTDYGVIGAPTGNPMINGGHTGNVADADPRIISNLIVDMSVNNPAAVEVWFASEAALAAFHERYGEDAIPVRPGEGTAPIALTNAGFEAQSLADGQPGVITDALGNYTLSAPTGWTISGGLGGTFSPAASVIDPAGHSGGNVAWLTSGAVLSQTAGVLTANSSYTLSFNVGDRTDQAWSGGTARLVAVSTDGSTTVLATSALSEPVDGEWTPMSISTGPVAAGLAGQALRIEIAQTGGAQVLVDDVSVSGSSGNFIEIDDTDMASIPNISPDEGISKPFNAWMTFFGQFFDHGLDLITKGDNGTVYIPLQPDDPLITHGPDGIAGSGDEVPAERAFMVMTRSTPVAGPGADGILGTADDTAHEGRNTTTPFVDQNQTYTSHPSHQVFLREYHMVGGNPVATGRLLDGSNGGLPTWADIKTQAREMLGIELTDQDVLNLPLLRTDAYGEFVRDPVTGFAQVVTGLGLDGIPNTADDETVSGTPDAPVNTFSALAVRTGHAFLDDIAHSANPGGKFADDDSAEGLSDSTDVAGKYDNELLDRHFITGDGRGNENIGLTAVHHIFHSEHNRQIDMQQLTILQTGDLSFINEWLATEITELPPGFAGLDVAAQRSYAESLSWDGERLFQAGRFATEMQYQHLVFEEFARKIHPNIDPFVFNSVTDINPSIFAEFANTVYRFGHSMLTDGMPRVYADGSTDDVGLITSFLNPVLFDNDMTISADEAAGAVVRGMTAERGNEIDEFVVSSLRNNLVGLPLDLAAINIARGRDTGVPSLNDARAQLFEQTGSTFLKPYANWVEFAAQMSNPVSVINFIAAYGLHGTIAAADTIAEKREAASALVFGGAGAPADRVQFLTGTGAWSAQSSGLNNIDLWIGGLAERNMPFGGMLGSTFTAIFEAQLEALQFGDRFYYLSRTQGQNFLNELENNSLTKMILANTDLAQPGADGIRGTDDDVVARHIGTDSFAAYDYVLEVNKDNQVGDDPVGDDPILEALGLGKVLRDDLQTVGTETNYLKFTGGEHVVLGGTEASDTLIGGDGDDGIWGDAGDDVIEAGFGVDLVNGGAGDDIITDMGDEGDFLKGDDGNDVMSTSSGLDILMGGRGKDVIFLGADSSEIFGGEGDDFIMGGVGADFLLGNEGNDWMEAGDGFDTTAGDNSELFFNSAIKGHDVMFAGTEEHDFDAESGDDIMVQGESVMRNEGMFGFDWAIYKGVGFGADADLRVPIFTTEQADILRNRFDKTEALSGWEHDDILRGDDRVQGAPNTAAGVGGAEGVFFNDGIDAEGLARIDGFSDIVAITAANGLWEEGNVLLGGGGSDLLQGNGGNDILDGDRWLNVRISIKNDAGVEIGTVDTLKHVFSATDGVPAGWVGNSLFELLTSRTIRPDQMSIQREILNGGAAGDIDVALFADNRANYTVTSLGGGVVQVAHTGFGNNAAVLVDDGTDIVRNVEVLSFADGDLFIGPAPTTGAPVVSDTTPTEGQALTVNLAGIADANGIASIAVRWQVSNDNGASFVNIPGATNPTFTPAQAQVGRPIRAEVTVTDQRGDVTVIPSSATAIVGDSVAVLFGGTLNGTAGADLLQGGLLANTLNGQASDDTLFGGAGNDTLNGQDGVDVLEGGLGNDQVFGGAGDDTIVWSAGILGDGRDRIDGGANDGEGDTFIVNGNATAEVFRVYSAAAAAAAGITGLNANTEIVITRNGTNTASVIAELDNIEEIIINTGPGADTVIPIGNFNPTSLNFNTIKVNGSEGDDTVDITTLDSAHRILFRTNGGNDTIVGTLRPQDVIELPEGASLSDYTVTTDANGVSTLTGNGKTITFIAPNGMPTIAEKSGNDVSGADDVVTTSFALSSADLAGLKALVTNQPVPGGDDDTEGVGGVRSLSGAGNNVDNPEFGAADQPFIRLTDARYGDPDSFGNRAINPVFEGLDPRAISNALGAQEAGLPTSAQNANIFFMAFGQYFDHGLDFLPKSSANGTIEIGGPGMVRAPGSDNPADLTRAEVALIDADGVPQHLNKTSPYVDQNQAYGSHELVGQFLRESDGDQGFGMRLLQGEPDPSNPAFNLIPTLRALIQHHWNNDTIFVDAALPGGSASFRSYFTDRVGSDGSLHTLVDAAGEIDPVLVAELAGNFMGSGNALLLDTNPFIDLLDHRVAGDGRANENFALTAVHTVWARNHNFHVENLIEQGFEGTDEEIFQAAKMLNESDYQRVVFTDFADKLLGGMKGQGDHGWDGYNPDADARISHEFASSVYRVGHSLISQTMTVIGPDGAPIQVPLFDAFLNPTNEAGAFNGPLPAGYTPQPGYAQHGVGAILGGIVTQPAEEVDFNIVDAVRNDLVRINADLFAFNVARGWDVGIGTLNQVRADLRASTNPYIAEAASYAGNLDPYTSWQDFQARNNLSDAVIAQFQLAYPDLVLTTAEDIAAFASVNPDIALADGPDGTKIVKGIDRVDLWVGGLAETHINGGVVGQTFWVVLHEQFDRLQEGDRFYYLSRFENFDFYGTIGEDTTMANILARTTGLETLDSSVFDSISDLDEDEEDTDTEGENGGDDDDTNGDNDTDEDGDGETDGDEDTAEDTGEDDGDGGDTDEDDDDQNEETDPGDDTDDEDDDGTTDEDDGADTDDDDAGPVQPPLAASGAIVGSTAADALFGTESRDAIMGLAGRDVIFGGAGNDDILGGAGADMVFGDAGNDRLLGEGGNDFLDAGAGSDTVFGGDGDDVIVASVGDGDDVYYGDDMVGGSGSDTADYSAITASIVADLGTGFGTRGHVQSAQSGNDVVWSIETFLSGSGNDVITSGNGANVIDGGAGNDTFRFTSTEAAHGDTILGFAPGDRIDLSGIDANGSQAGNGTFSIVSGGLTGTGQLLISEESRADGIYTVIEGNTSGDAAAEFKIGIKGQHDLKVSDFEL